MSDLILLEAYGIPRQPLGDQYLEYLCLKQGECIRLYGRNGAGKSTILRSLAGLLFDERLSLKGERSFFLTDHALHLPGLTVREYIAYIEKLYGKACKDVSYLRSIIDQPIETLSLGQMQQLKLLLMLVTDCKVWLLDEPDQALDKQSIVRLNHLLKVFTDNGGGVIYASHNDSLYSSQRIEVE
jgi:ABC-type multidrug transport system ATPase subunit